MSDRIELSDKTYGLDNIGWLGRVEEIGVNLNGWGNFRGGGDLRRIENMVEFGEVKII